MVPIQVVAVTALLVLGSAPAVDQSPGCENPGPLFHPEGPQSWCWRLGMGASVDILPRRLVEAEIRQIVRLVGNFRLGLPHGLSLQAELKTAFFTHDLRAGGSWSLDTGPVTWMARYHLGFWIGYLAVSGFDTTSWGLVSYPGIGVGARIGPHRLSLVAETIIPHLRTTRFGSATVSSRKSSWGGFGISLTVESPLGPGLIFYGITLLRADQNYQLWLAFSDNPFKLFYSRIFAGYAI